MNRFLNATILFCCLFLAALVPVHAQGLLNVKGVELSAASSEFQQSSKRFVLKGNVRISTGEGLITCDQASVNTETMDFEAKGDVTASGLSAGTEMSSEHITGNLRTRLIHIDGYKGRTGPWYLVGDTAESGTDRSITAHNVVMTTCDHVHLDKPPHYHLRADKIVYNEDGTYKAEGMKTYFGEIPVFYLPSFKSHIAGGDGGFTIVPGYSSNWDAFLLMSRKFKVSKTTTNTVMFDVRQDDGVAFGNLTESKADNYEWKSLFYFMPESKMDPEDTGRFDEPNERYQVDVFNRYDLNDDWTWRMKLDATSDIDYKKEFVTDISRSELEQSLSYLDLEHMTDNSSLSLSAYGSLNDHDSSVDRLPELRYDLPNYRLGSSKFFYTTHSSAGYYKTRWRDFDEPLNIGVNGNEDYDSSRIDSLHALKYNTQISDWLNFTPRAAVRLTHYSDSSEQAVTAEGLRNLIGANDPYRNPTSGVNNYDDQGGDKLRLVGEIGYELSFKAYKTWHDATHEGLGVDGLRHVMRPYINHNYIASSEDRDHLYLFDEVDRIEDQHWIRTGVENRIQTRREGKIHTLVTVNNWIDFHLPNSGDRENGTGDFGTHIEFNPYEDLSFENDMTLDMETGEMNLYSMTARIGDPNKLQYTLRYLYRDDLDSRDIYSNASTVYNPMGVSSYSSAYDRQHLVDVSMRYLFWYKHFVELGSNYDLEEGEFVSYYLGYQRKIHAWTATMRYEMDDNDYKIMLYLYLNAYPNLNIGSN